VNETLELIATSADELERCTDLVRALNGELLLVVVVARIPDELATAPVASAA